MGNTVAEQGDIVGMFMFIVIAGWFGILFLMWVFDLIEVAQGSFNFDYIDTGIRTVESGQPRRRLPKFAATGLKKYSRKRTPSPKPKPKAKPKPKPKAKPVKVYKPQPKPKKPRVVKHPLEDDCMLAVKALGARESRTVVRQFLKDNNCESVEVFLREYLART